MTVVELAGAVRGGTELRGRAAELTAVEAGLAAARRGRGSVMLVEGRPGMGRTRFLREVLHRADRAGVRTLAGEAVDGQQAVPFAPLLTAVLDGESPIADPVALRAAAARADLRYWVSHDLRTALEAAAVHGPLAIVLDDLQWADRDTLTALRALTSGLRETGILWVLAFAGAGAEPPVREAMSHLARAGALRLRLAPLVPAETAAVIRDLVGVPADPDLLTFAARAGGVPFVLTELVRGLREEGRLRIGAGSAGVLGSAAPRRLTEVMTHRLGRLGPDARQAMLMAALLPRRFTATQLATLLGCRPSALVGPLDDLLRADLVTGEGEHLRIPCDLLRGAVRASVPESLRTALHHETVGSHPVAVLGPRVPVARPRPRPTGRTGAGPTPPGRALTGLTPSGPDGPGPASGDRRVDGLTPSERKVADLIAAGATNRAAAQRLCLSPHTVGTHLRHIFEKLGINSRVELANLMHERAA